MVVILSLPNTSFGENSVLFAEALTQGIPSYELRLGLENTTTDDNTSPGKGVNLRMRVGYRTGEFENFNIFVQFHKVTNFIEQFRFMGGGDQKHRC